MDKLIKQFKKIENKKFSLEEAFRMMEKIRKLYNKDNKNKPKQIEMELKFERHL